MAQTGTDNVLHLDRRVSWGLVLGFALQTMTFIWVGATWKESVNARLDVLERADNERRPQEARLIRVEERMQSMYELMQRIDQRLAGEHQ